MNTQNLTPDFAATLLAAITASQQSGVTLNQPGPDVSAPYAVLPAGYKIADLEEHLIKPVRKRGIVNLHTVASFIQLVNVHKNEGTQVYADQDDAKFVAVINDHGAEDAAWRDHQVVYDAPFSSEWTTWKAMDGKPMSQEDFARFIERNILDIQKPANGAMLEISRTLQTKTSVDFKSATRLDNGEVKFGYQEEIKGTAGVEGNIEIPDEILLGIPVLQGGGLFAFPAKFRYRVTSGKLSLWYELVRPHKVLEAAVNAIVDAIQSPDASYYAGLPEDHPHKAGNAPLPDFGTGLRVLYGKP